MTMPPSFSRWPGWAKWSTIAGGLGALILLANAVTAGSVIEPLAPATRGYVRHVVDVVATDRQSAVEEAIEDVQGSLVRISGEILSDRVAKTKSDLRAARVQLVQMQQALEASPGDTRVRTVIAELQADIREKEAWISAACAASDIFSRPRAC